VKNLDATSLSGTVKNFLSRSGKLLVSKETNSLIITDLPDNINIVRELVKRLDVRVRLETKFVELENAQVADVYTQIKSIADIVIDNKIETEKISIFKHETSNTLTFVGPNKSIQKLLPYVKRFDESDNMTDQNIYFVKLNNAEASEVLSILNQVIGKRVYDKGQEKPSVTVDKELNALIVISSEKEYKEFLELIAKLDVERKQVYVKARIVEISESKTRDIGFKYGLEGFALNEGGLYTLASTLNGGSSFVASSVASGIGLPSGITEGFGLGVSLAFLGKKSAANTLSEPSILCINNQESSIYVGQTQSIQSGTTVTSGGNTQNSYTREDIGLTLKIKPRISNDSKVILNVDATLEDVVAGSGEGSPTTTKREVKTVAVVKNGGSVIVGGLIKNKVDEAESKIPFLGDIPILGYLFKNKYYLKDKVHLVIMLTPYIVEKSEDLEELRNSLKTLSELERKVVNKFISEKMMDEDDIRIESVEPRSDIDFDD
jgi:general secretion pathway protein D